MEGKDKDLPSDLKQLWRWAKYLKQQDIRQQRTMTLWEGKQVRSGSVTATACCLENILWLVAQRRTEAVLQFPWNKQTEPGTWESQGGYSSQGTVQKRRGCIKTELKRTTVPLKNSVEYWLGVSLRKVSTLGKDPVEIIRRTITEAQIGPGNRL